MRSSMGLAVAALVACCVLVAEVEGRALEREGRSLTACRGIAISSAKRFSSEKNTIADAVADAVASADSCESVTAAASASAEAISEAFATAIAATSAKIAGRGCTKNSYANAVAGAKAFAKASATAVATALAAAYLKEDEAYAEIQTEDFQEVIESAIALSESYLQGTGTTQSVAVAQVAAKATAQAIAQAMAEVECKEGEDVKLPFEGEVPEGIPPLIPEECRCSQEDTVEGVFTGRAKCKQHGLATNPRDTGYFCYATGGKKCAAAIPDPDFPGAFYISCTP